MALVVRDRHDPIARAIHHCARLSSQGPDEPQRLHVRNNTMRELDETDSRRRAIVPIGIFFSLSLIFGNLVYLYLSVSFIQMLKVCYPSSITLTTTNGYRPPTRSLLLSPPGLSVLPPFVLKLSETYPSLLSVLSLPRLARSSSALSDLSV